MRLTPVATHPLDLYDVKCESMTFFTFSFLGSENNVFFIKVDDNVGQQRNGPASLRADCDKLLLRRSKSSHREREPVATDD